jgi:hypothetical protein|tara:strand:- start:61159 stop:61320 length:162 start_codon:yes stop_codon:yes gene_type:complete
MKNAIKPKINPDITARQVMSPLYAHATGFGEAMGKYRLDKIDTKHTSGLMPDV